MKNFILLLFVCFAFYGAAPAQSSTSPKDLLMSGQAKEDKRDPKGALADYEQAIRLRPDLAEAYFRRGRVLARQGKTNAAVSDFSTALDLDPSLTSALVDRAILLLTRRQDYIGSIADFDKLINLGLDLDKSYYHRALAKVRLRDFHGAIADYTALIDLPSRQPPDYKPGSFKSMAYPARAAARLALNDFDQAIADFTIVLKHEPRNGWIYFQRARAFAAKGDHENAQADYKKAAELSPDLSRAIDHGRGHRSDSAGVVGATNERQALSEEPKNAADYYKRGNVFFHQKLYDSAIADFTKAIELDPKFHFAYNNRGIAFSRKKEFQAAIAGHSRTIELAPLEESGYTNRGIARERAGDLEGAIKDFARAVELAPQMAHLYENRGIALLLIGRDDEAKRDFEQCLRIDPSAGQRLDQRIKWAERQGTTGRR